MTLDDLGNLGEIVAAIGVVVSLIYLGRQIRQNTAHLSQNTQSVQLSALEATVESGNRVRELLIVNPELSELYTKGLEGYSQLDRTERLRFGMLLTNLFGAVQASHMRTGSRSSGRSSTNGWRSAVGDTAPEAEAAVRFGLSSRTMVLEVAILNVRPGESDGFETAFLEAQQILSDSAGYQRHELRRCLEAADRYLLLVWWESLESHTEGFRQSPEYRRWRELLHRFYDPFPTVEHYVVVPGAAA